MGDGGHWVITITGTQVAAVIGLIVGFASAALAGFLRFRKLGKRVLTLFEHFADDWSGVADRDGVKGRPGMMLRVAQLEDGMSEVRAELREVAALVRSGVFVAPTPAPPHSENEWTGV